MTSTVYVRVVRMNKSLYINTSRSFYKTLDKDYQAPTSDTVLDIDPKLHTFCARQGDTLLPFLFNCRNRLDPNQWWATNVHIHFTWSGTVYGSLVRIFWCCGLRGTSPNAYKPACYGTLLLFMIWSTKQLSPKTQHITEPKSLAYNTYEVCHILSITLDSFTCITSAMYLTVLNNWLNGYHVCKGVSLLKSSSCS